MRPVNLIPEGKQQGARKQLRTGPLAYIVVGALFAALLGVTALVVTGNQISDREAEIAQLTREDADEKARLAELSGYTSFHAASQQRVATVASLAASRFDWERVMRELTLVLPGDVWLTDLTGTASAEATVEGASGIALRSSVPGPALELSGCAAGQESVAGFVSALKEIDGVTRVGVQSSQIGDREIAEGATASGAASGGGTCQTQSFIAAFEIVVAFDAAPVPVTGAVE
ncbi:MAG TPA: PilN domain-containing protein [Solirubrobacterales bacterium]|nr:PilN domain-containing protein [Solirubrobacterales bacterium]